jgi:dihydroxy-acid dehydratase
VKQHCIEMDVSPEDLEVRRSRWSAPSPKATRGTLYKYVQSVSSASLGCVTDDAGKTPE